MDFSRTFRCITVDKAKALFYVEPPRLFSCRITEKQWYEATDEASCYFLKTGWFTVYVDLSQYNRIKTGDDMVFALLRTRKDHLLFWL